MNVMIAVPITELYAYNNEYNGRQLRCEFFIFSSQVV